MSQVLQLEARTWHVAAKATFAGFCTLGAQFGNNAASGLLYPTAFRSRGVGWALGVGRFGSIVGPLVGGMLIGMNLPLHQLFLIAAVPMVAGLVASIAIARLCYKRLGGMHLDDMPEIASPAPTEVPGFG